MEFFLIILAIIGALSGFFKDKSDTETKKTKRPASMPKPSGTPSGRTYQNSETASQQATVDTTSIDMQQEEQRKQLAERMNTTAAGKDAPKNEHDSLPDTKGNKQTNVSHVHHERLKKQMPKNMKRDGLINGIIMSEVLGPPRAKKPYRSIIKERRN